MDRKERQGWYYALTHLHAYDALLWNRVGARAGRAVATDFRRVRLGLEPAGHPGRDHDSGTREGVQLTIDTQTDSYEQAIRAVQGRQRPQLRRRGEQLDGRSGSGVQAGPGRESLSGENLGQG
jgi:hypothetical protein